MGKVRTLRLPDDMEDEVDAYLVEHKIKFTDVVIAGINRVLHEDESKAVVLSPEVVCVVEASPPVIKRVKDIPKVLPVLEKAIEKKVSSGGFFHPMSEEHQTRNAGKKR